MLRNLVAAGAIFTQVRAGPIGWFALNKPGRQRLFPTGKSPFGKLACHQCSNHCESRHVAHGAEQVEMRPQTVGCTPKGIQKISSFSLNHGLLSSGPQKHFENNVKIICLRKICWFGKMQHAPRNNPLRKLRFLELLRNSLRSSRTKQSGDQWSKLQHVTEAIRYCCQLCEIQQRWHHRK